MADASLLIRLRRSALSVKLAALGAAVTAVVVFLAFLALSVEIRGSTERSLIAELLRNQKALKQIEAHDASQLVFAAGLVTQTPSFQYDLSIYRSEKNTAGRTRTDLVNTMEDELNTRLRRVDGDLLLVTDDSGRVFAAAGSNGVTVPRATNLTPLGAVAHALDPRAPADVGGLGVLRTDVGYYQVAAYPLVQAGITLGSLVLGRRLDSAFINAARATSDAGVILTAGRVVVAAGDSIVDAAAAAPLLAARGSDTAAATVRVNGDDYVVAPVLLGETQAREPVRLWMLHPLTSRVTALMRPLRTKFFIYGAFAVFVAAVGAAFTARTVLGPVKRFIGYMRSGAAAEERQGGFDASNEALEVRTLNESFNQLMDSLAARRRELEERTAELLTANVVLTDEIGERRRVEQALRESQAQLRQSQKLEAIGTLAGGIAHDFNNLITVITGYTQLALMRTGQGTPEAADLRQVVDASDRAANLTHQLLAFSRKQVLQPTVLDLGAVVDGIAPMLQRIIGEHIELFIESAGPLARVRADRGQLEQVLLNLAVNARDAMSSSTRGGGAGGKLTIATRTVVTAKGSSAVELAVSDTGTGMTDDVRDRAFEPFFTTKEPGKGTGLGLSTVYGIVNQSGGTIAVDSTPGRGTTFTIALPASDLGGGGEPQTGDNGELPRGTETVLIVEDADDVRILARRTLQERGYTVLVARDAQEAMEIAGTRNVDLLLTDIVMPRTSGPQLVAKYAATREHPIVVYMSGYADDALSQYELDPAVVFVRKPFTPATLSRVVRSALDAHKAARAGSDAAD